MADAPPANRQLQPELTVWLEPVARAAAQGAICAMLLAVLLLPEGADKVLQMPICLYQTLNTSIQMNTVIDASCC